MQQFTDSMLIIDNEKLYKAYGDLPIFEAFQRTDDILKTAVKGISEIITKPGFMNVDFADVKMVMKQSGMALMGTGSGSGENRALKAVETAFTSPLLNDADLSRSRNVLINITSGKEKALSMTELSQIMGYIADYTGGVANFKRGIICDPTIQDEIKVTVIATGFSIHSLPPIAVYGDEPGKEKNNKVSIYLDGEPAEDEGMENVPEHEFSHMDQGSDEFRITNNRSIFTVQPAAMPEPVVPQKKPVLILDADQNIAELEQVPAFKRREARYRMTGQVDIAKSSPNKMEEKNGQQRLSTDNAYIHQTQD